MESNETENKQSIEHSGVRLRANNPAVFQLMVSSVVILVLLTAVIVTVGFRGPDVEAPVPQAELEQTDAEEVTEQIDPLQECVHRMPLPFGGKARTKCLLHCYGPDIDTPLCESVCDQRFAEDFARSLLWQGHSPEPVARQIATACLDREPVSVEGVARSDWAEKTEKIVEYLQITDADIERYDRRELIVRFQQAEKIDEVIPPLDNASHLQLAFLTQLRAVLCMRQSIATTQLAVLLAAQNSDQFSERFYRKIEESLLASLSTLEGPISAAHMAALVDDGQDEQALGVN